MPAVQLFLLIVSASPGCHRFGYHPHPWLQVPPRARRKKRRKGASSEEDGDSDDGGLAAEMARDRAASGGGGSGGGASSGPQGVTIQRALLAQVGLAEVHPLPAGLLM